MSEKKRESRRSLNLHWAYFQRISVRKTVELRPKVIESPTEIGLRCQTSVFFLCTRSSGSFLFFKTYFLLSHSLRLSDKVQLSRDGFICGNDLKRLNKTKRNNFFLFLFSLFNSGKKLRVVDDDEIDHHKNSIMFSRFNIIFQYSLLHRWFACK